MAYARPGEFSSDVYVYATSGWPTEGNETVPVVVCHGGFHDGHVFETPHWSEMIEHLERHQDAGDTVPERALERLTAERDGLTWETDVQRVVRELRESG